MSLRLYDISSDGMRDVTQKDIDLLEATRAAYGRLRTAFDEIHAEFRSKVGDINERYRVQSIGDAAAEPEPADKEPEEEA